MTRIPRIISVDDHVVEPPHLWQTWLPAGLRDRGPRVVRDSFDGGPVTDWWVYENIRKPMPLASHWAGRGRDELSLQPIGFDDMRPGFYDPKERLADMDANHTERSMCFPNALPRFCGQTFYEGSDRGLGLACVRAYNDWMIEEWCGDSGGRLIPLCLVPLWDPALAGDEVRRNAARGCTAITFSELPSNLGLPSIHDQGRYWDPLFQACDETGTVVCMHIGSGSKMPTSSPDAPQGVGIALTTQNAMVSMADWLLSGVLRRFPNLKIAYSESQIGWMPFMFERIDNVFLKSRAWANLDPALDDLPTAQIPGRVYGCFFEDDFGVGARDAIGIDQITFEIDYPHQDTSWPASLPYLEKVTADLTDAEVHKIVRGNAITMLGLPDTLPVVLAQP
jgi:predicted TIM-barrel fold metal-dependent hydrolase